MKYTLDIARDIDPDGDEGFILNLPRGFRFYDEVVHVRGYDTMEQLIHASKQDVIQCDCVDCR